MPIFICGIKWRVLLWRCILRVFNVTGVAKLVPVSPGCTTTRQVARPPESLPGCEWVARLLVNVSIQNGSARAYLLTFVNIVTVAGLFRIAGTSNPSLHTPAGGSAGNRPPMNGRSFSKYFPQHEKGI